MLKIVTVAAAFAVIVTGAHAAAPAVTYRQAPELQPFFDRAFGDKFKVSGTPQVATPDQLVPLFNGWSLRPALVVPVAFARTARLDQDVVLGAPGDKHPIVMPKGSLLYHAVFRRDASQAQPIEAWCGVGSWHIYGSDHYASQCLVKTPDGHAVIYNGDTWHDFDPKFSMENVKGGIKAPHWFAFGLNDGALQPIEYPAMTETAMPSPDMAIILRFDFPVKDKATGQTVLLTTWALRGPDGDIPTTGPLVSFEVPVVNGKIVVPMGAHRLQADYTSDGKSLNNVTVVDAPPEAVMAAAVTAPADRPVKTEPQAVDDPWLFGAMVVDGKAADINTRPMAGGDIFLSAPAHLGPRYRLTAPTQSGFYYFEPGTGFYKAEYTGYEGNGGAYKMAAWCGPGESRPLGAHFKFIVCTPAAPGDTYGAFFVKNWELIGFLKDPKVANGGMDLKLEPDPDPAPQPRTFQIRVVKIGSEGMELKLGLLGGDNFTMQERYEVAFDANRTARLHLWDRTVEFTAAGNQVTAKIVPGDGHGPRYPQLQVLDGGY